MCLLLPRLAQDAALFLCTIIKMSVMSVLGYAGMISVQGAVCSQRLVLYSRLNTSPGQTPREGEHREYLLKKKKNVLKRIVGKLISLTRKLQSHRKAPGVKGLAPLKSNKVSSLLHCVAFGISKVRQAIALGCFRLFLLPNQLERRNPQSTQAALYS